MHPLRTITPTLEPTDDGSVTLRHPLLGDTYHSLRGAVGEAAHVYIANGLAALPLNVVRILEVGFGSGLNALLSLLYAADHSLDITYHAVEAYPIDPSCVASFGYPEVIGCDPVIFQSLHDAPWDTSVSITDRFILDKRFTRIEDYPFDSRYDLVYWDAFAPDTATTQWSTEIFSRLYSSMTSRGILVTYCSKGIVKQALRAAGFHVKRLPGAPGKRHMIIASVQEE